MVLRDRREILQALVPAGGHIQFSEAGVVSKRLDGVYRGATMNWRKVKCFVEKEMDIICAKCTTGKPAMMLPADNGRYMGRALITFKADKRQQLWERVLRKAGAPSPKEKAELLRPGLVGRAKTLRGEQMLRHVSSENLREK